MKFIQESALPSDVREFMRRWTDLISDKFDVRALQTSGGDYSLAIEKCRFTEHGDLRIDLNDSEYAEKSLTLVLVDHGSQEMNLDLILDELASVSELIAVPTYATPRITEELVQVGRIQQSISNAFASEFLVFVRTPSIRERLLHDAPTDIGETDNNLSGRERWYKKRHGNDD